MMRLVIVMVALAVHLPLSEPRAPVAKGQQHPTLLPASPRHGVGEGARGRLYIPGMYAEARRDLTVHFIGRCTCFSEPRPEAGRTYALSRAARCKLVLGLDSTVSQRELHHHLLVHGVHENPHFFIHAVL